MGGSGVHESVGNEGGAVADRHSYGVLGVQDEGIHVIISDQKHRDSYIFQLWIA